MSETTSDGLRSETYTDKGWDEKRTHDWEELQAEVRKTKKEPEPAQSEFHEALIKKYRKQGLNL